MRFEVYRDEQGQWRWRLRATNHRIIASGEGYKNRVDCYHAVWLVRRQSTTAPVENLVETAAVPKLGEK